MWIWQCYSLDPIHFRISACLFVLFCIEGVIRSMMTDEGKQRKATKARVDLEGESEIQKNEIQAQDDLSVRGVQ